MTDIRRLLGLNIRKYRTERGLTQEKLAEKARLATNYLGLIECGKKFPSAPTIEKIAAALNRDTVDLFTLTEIRQEWKRYILDEIETLIRDKLQMLDR
jgi:transcriptional regulator with XRE-family HTH domain